MIRGISFDEFKTKKEEGCYKLGRIAEAVKY